MKTESKVYLSEDLSSLSDKLVYLEWDGYPSTSLPVNFTPENLVELVMPNSRLKQLWNEDQVRYMPSLGTLYVWISNILQNQSY